MALADKKCMHPNWEKVQPMKLEKAHEYLDDLPGWTLDDDESMLSKKFEFHDFTEAMAFVNQVAEIAEKEQHHPDIHIFFKKVNLDLWTHAIQGLHENDFIMAAKINNLI